MKILFILLVFFSIDTHAYTYKAQLDIIALKSSGLTKKKIQKIISRAQNKFDKCDVEIQLGSIKLLERPDLKDWENYWFTQDGEFTYYENWLASRKLPKTGITLIFVDTLNWTIDGQGTWAAAYAPFLLEHELPNKSFFKKKLQGTIIIGRYRATWTVAHELGHVLMNLEHFQDGRNIMHTGTGSFEPPQFNDNQFMISSLNPKFSKDQCKQGIKNSLYIKKRK